MDSSEKPEFTGEYLSNVDGNEAASMAAECTCEPCTARFERSKVKRASFSDYDCVDPKREPPNWDHFLFLCRPEVPGYILSERKWGESHTENWNPLSRMCVRESADSSCFIRVAQC